MANVLKDEKKQQIITLGRLGWSLRKIQEATRVRRETISAYLRGAGVEIWPPGRWRRESKAKTAIEVITGESRSQCHGNLAGSGLRLRISGWLSKRSALRLQVARSPSTKARAVILTAPGEEGQVDYGSGPMVREPQSRKYRRTRLFVWTFRKDWTSFNSL